MLDQNDASLWIGTTQIKIQFDLSKNHSHCFLRAFELHLLSLLLQK